MATIEGQEKVLACKEHIINQVNKSFEPEHSAQFALLNLMNTVLIKTDDNDFIAADRSYDQSKSFGIYLLKNLKKYSLLSIPILSELDGQQSLSNI